MWGGSLRGERSCGVEPVGTVFAIGEDITDEVEVLVFLVTLRRGGEE